MAEKGQKCLFFVDEITPFDAKKMVGKGKKSLMLLCFLPDGFVFSPRWFCKTPRGVFKNTPPFTEKHPTVNFTTPYHHANDTLSWCNTTPVDLLENTLFLITKDLWR